MNHTSNYQLPQWEEHDRILRTDFNGMTETIDAALGALAGGLPWVALREFSLDQAAARWPLDLSGIHPGQYAGLRLSARSPGHVKGKVGLQLNGLTSGYAYRTASSLNPSEENMIRLSSYGSFFTSVELRPGGEWTLFFCDGVADAYERMEGLWLRGIHRQLAYSSISSAVVLCEEEDAQLAAGTAITLYGLRA